MPNTVHRTVYHNVSNPAAVQKPDELVVFEIVRDSTCAECGDPIDRGQFLRVEAERPLCLGCADLGHLVFLPRRDAALTRRATKYSSLKVVVVRFSRARQRYERQGVLVTDAALHQAETECLADGDARARQQVRRAERGKVADIEYRGEFARRLREISSMPRTRIACYR